mgnify:CR=1 FL=1
MSFDFQANEINEVMGRTYGMPEVDEDDLAAELDALGDEIGKIIPLNFQIYSVLS